MAESEPTPPNHIGPVLELLASAGYGDAKNSQFSDFEMLLHGLAWCISSANTSDHPYTIETVDDIGEALKLMGCPHVVQATWIEDLNYVCIYPAVKWVVSLINARQHENSDENARKAVLEEMQVLKEKIEEARIGSVVQTLASLLKISKDLERQGAVLQSDYNLNRLRLQIEITQLEEQLANDNSDNNPHEYFDRTNIELSKKLTYAKKELSSKLREIVSLKRQLDELPIDAELVQYERRFSELNVHMQDRHSQTRKYYETYNALLEIKDLMLKETSLLNSVDAQFGDAIGNNAGRAKLIDSMEVILKGIQQKLEKVQLGLQLEQKTLNTLREQYTAAVMNQRQCSALLKDYQEECRNNEMLKKEVEQHEKQRSPNSS